jgi:L-cysteine/cystine lyase
MHPEALRAEFPVLARSAFLNAGTAGPLPRAALEAGARVLEQATAEGRTQAYFAERAQTRERQRTAYAGLLGAEADDVALTTSASEGIARVLLGLDLRRGDEILTADNEHHGLLGTLGLLRAQRGVEVRMAPLTDLADAVGPRTRVVACSHVSWVTGTVAPAALGELGDELPVLLDGAQGIGAVPVDVGALGCAFYAGPGQKWMCGPVGTGMLWVSPLWRERLPPLGLAYVNVADPYDPLGGGPHPTARRHDAPAVSAEACATALAAHDVLAAHGWPEVHARASALARRLAERLRESGRVVAPRGDSTLVAWEDPDPVASRARLAAEGIVVRDLPGTPLLRASVGAWNDDEDLERLLAAL